MLISSVKFYLHQSLEILAHYPAAYKIHVHNTMSLVIKYTTNVTQSTWLSSAITTSYCSRRVLCANISCCRRLLLRLCPLAQGLCALC